MVRLNANILPPVPDIVCDPSCLRYTIALLNVRSILHQVPDITADKILSSANILCFCETWLNGSQCSPVLRPNQIHIRCDRLTCENKGGVMMYVPSQMQLSDIHRFARSGIEAVSCMLLLPNQTPMQIALVYRSPSVSRTTLIAMLTRLLKHVSVSSAPCLILGDFNEDLLHQINSPILTLMSEHGFSQLVTSPTTPQGTLLDHVYCRNPPNHVAIQVKDTYYSDHDTVYCSMPF